MRPLATALIAVIATMGAAAPVGNPLMRQSTMASAADANTVTTDAFPLATKTGSTFLAFLSDAVQQSTLTDNMGNEYTLVGAMVTGGSIELKVFACVNGIGGVGHTLNATFAELRWPSLFAIEVDNVGSVWEDVIHTASINTGVDGLSPFEVSTGGTALIPGSLVFVFMGGSGGAIAAINDFILAEKQEDDSYWCGAVAYKQAISTDPLTGGFTMAAGGQPTLHTFAIKPVA